MVTAIAVVGYSLRVWDYPLSTVRSMFFVFSVSTRCRDQIRNDKALLEWLWEVHQQKVNEPVTTVQCCHCVIASK